MLLEASRCPSTTLLISVLLWFCLLGILGTPALWQCPFEFSSELKRFEQHEGGRWHFTRKWGGIKDRILLKVSKNCFPKVFGQFDATGIAIWEYTRYISNIYIKYEKLFHKYAHYSIIPLKVPLYRRWFISLRRSDPFWNNDETQWVYFRINEAYHTDIFVTCSSYEHMLVVLENGVYRFCTVTNHMTNPTSMCTNFVPLLLVNWAIPKKTRICPETSLMHSD